MCLCLCVHLQEGKELSGALHDLSSIGGGSVGQIELVLDARLELKVGRVHARQLDRMSVVLADLHAIHRLAEHRAQRVECVFVVQVVVVGVEEVVVARCRRSFAHVQVG